MLTASKLRLLFKQLEKPSGTLVKLLCDSTNVYEQQSTNCSYNTLHLSL